MLMHLVRVVVFIVVVAAGFWESVPTGIMLLCALVMIANDSRGAQYFWLMLISAGCFIWRMSLGG